jgi:hypothetical protein
MNSCVLGLLLRRRDDFIDDGSLVRNPKADLDLGRVLVCFHDHAFLKFTTRRSPKSARL